MHAGLTNSAKTEMQDLFNDPKSSFRALVMPYDVGAMGRNLHIACGRMCLLTLGKHRSQEEQCGGRASRVSVKKYFLDWACN
jgi:hypothetical protein